MRFAILAFLFPVAAIAADDHFLKGAELAAEAEKSCKDGCVLLNRAEAEAINKVIGELQKRAFLVGVETGEKSCRVQRI